MARWSPVGYPKVLISWFGAAKRMGACIIYCSAGHKCNTYPGPDEFKRVLRRSVTVLAGLAGSQLDESRGRSRWRILDLYASVHNKLKIENLSYTRLSLL